jgi:redox-sensitive bicupin YhaK (pirin superfamily)
MFTVRPGRARGRTQLNWLDSRHTFSFGDYFDPAHHHFRSLRVINDDLVAAGAGFGTHPHRDMEILTYVLKGAIAHKDSMGHGETVQQGEWQYMSAGSGILHSEFNPSPTEQAHFLQIWIVPEKKGLTPRYEQKSIPNDRPGAWAVVASRDGRDDSIAIRQDATLLSARLEPGQSLTYDLAPGRGGWLHVATGSIVAHGLPLEAGDALAIESEDRISFTAKDATEVFLFDLA